MPISTYRQFGAWLDDASAAGPGEGYTSIGVGHWRMLGSTQTNLPMLGIGVGVTDRMQVGASVPFYRASYEGGSASGMPSTQSKACMERLPFAPRLRRRRTPVGPPSTRS